MFLMTFLAIKFLNINSVYLILIMVLVIYYKQEALNNRNVIFIYGEKLG